ncbi:hypothetical protein H6S07_26280 (plasmid) [Escherichia coli]|nr:hypothetical protein H6S07_26280 [Escherichia coli]
MWILIFWLSSPFNVSSGDARQPTLAVHSQEFRTEKACRDAFSAEKRKRGRIRSPGRLRPRGE